jgi:shikimate dehydrogenase
MDVVYKPLKTRFLRDASERGCRCIDGLTMLLEQAVEQFRLWTPSTGLRTGGHEPRDVMRKALQEALKGVMKEPGA